jgi:hypothetical protein
MPSITIVALPSDDEIVWDLSSEKKPHMTLLYLNGPLGIDEEEIIQFVQFAANTSLCRFGLSVDHRGTLGPKDADVLFFSTEFGVDKLREFRAMLLKNNEIAKNYVSSDDQFPGWIPHLTMGYPEAPAKEVDPDHRYGLSWINFDRIAVWTDDFDGPEFLLKSHDMAVDSLNWSEDHGVYIMHSGVKGMRWGVRRDVGPGGLVKGTVAGAINGGQTPRAAEALGKVKRGKVSSDHKTVEKNIKKDVSHLSTSEIKEITKRLQAVRELNKATAEEKAARAGIAKKLTSFALNSVSKGIQKKADSYIQELIGDGLDGILPKTPSGTKRAQKEQQAQEDRAAKKQKESKTSNQSDKDAAVADLVNEVYQVTTLPKKED